MLLIYYMDNVVVVVVMVAIALPFRKDGSDVYVRGSTGLG